jgi:lipopolysaccharide export system protein LptC
MQSLATPADPRARLYDRLRRRNRVVGLLRWGVPAGGVVVLLVVIGGIVLASLSQRFGFSNMRIDRNNLVVDTPQLTSTGDDGTVFALSAVSAKVSIVQSDMVELAAAKLTATTPDGTHTEATAAAAQLQTTDQLLDVPGTTTIESTSGFHGTLDGVFLDIMKWTMVASGRVDLTLPDGTRVESVGMTFDRDKHLTTFTDVTVTLPTLPGDDAAAQAAGGTE